MGRILGNKAHGTGRRLLAALMLSVVAAVPARAQAPQALGCLIEPEQVADLGSPVIGVIEQLNAERGDLVRQGQVLAVLRSDVERAATEVARSRAQANAELQAAMANRNFAQQKFDRSQDLVARNFLSRHALDEATNELKIAEQRVAQARQQQQIWARELGMAQAQLAQRTLKSPFDGVVSERYLSPGERIEEKPIFRIARIDPLRVEVIVPAARFGTIRNGDTASVVPDLAAIPAQAATVTLVDRVVDAASNTFRVRLRLPNPDYAIPAGLRCRIEFAGGPAAPNGAGGLPAGVNATAGAASARR